MVTPSLRARNLQSSPTRARGARPQIPGSRRASDTPKQRKTIRFKGGPFDQRRKTINQFPLAHRCFVPWGMFIEGKTQNGFCVYHLPTDSYNSRVDRITTTFEGFVTFPQDNARRVTGLGAIENAIINPPVPPGILDTFKKLLHFKILDIQLGPYEKHNGRSTKVRFYLGINPLPTWTGENWNCPFDGTSEGSKVYDRFVSGYLDVEGSNPLGFYNPDFINVIAEQTITREQMFHRFVPALVSAHRDGPIYYSAAHSYKGARSFYLGDPAVSVLLTPRAKFSIEFPGIRFDDQFHPRKV